MALFNLKLLDPGIIQVLEPIYGSTTIPLISSKKLGDLYFASLEWLSARKVAQLRRYALVKTDFPVSEIDAIFFNHGLPIPARAGVLAIGDFR